MNKIPTTTILYYLIVSAVSVQCNTPKTIYVSNKTGKEFMLIVDHKDSEKSKNQSVIFKEALNKKTISRGHTIVNMGEGKWSKEDKKNLESILLNTYAVVDGSSDTIRLTTPRVVHYGLFVNELVIKIKKTIY